MTPQPDISTAVLLMHLFSAYQRIQDLEARLVDPGTEDREVDYDLLRALVADASRQTGASVSEIMSERRTGLIARARGRVICGLHNRGYSASAIGRALNRDHSTVLHWIRKGRG